MSNIEEKKQSVSPVESIDDVQRKRAQAIVDNILVQSPQLVEDIILLAKAEKSKPISKNFMAPYVNRVESTTYGALMQSNEDYTKLLDQAVVKHHLKSRLDLYGQLGKLRVGEPGVIEELTSRWHTEKKQRLQEIQINHTPLQPSILDEPAAK